MFCTFSFTNCFRGSPGQTLSCPYRAKSTKPHDVRERTEAAPRTARRLKLSASKRSLHASHCKANSELSSAHLLVPGSQRIIVFGSDALVRRNFSNITPLVITMLCLFRPTPATRNAYFVSSSWKVYFLPRLPHEMMSVLRQHEQTLCCCSFLTHCRQCFGHIHNVGGSRCLRSCMLFPLTCCVVSHRGGLGGGQDACVLASFSSHVLRCLAQRGF